MFSELIPNLMTEIPGEGRELVIKMARKTIAAIQPNE
ncbi:hexameric tyrosine-coordinated heme protein [Pseudoalteromonas sp. NBT06-2]